MSKAKWVFIICAFVCASYYGAWFLWKAMGWHWHASANIPGFIMLLISWPWSSAVFGFQQELQEYIGEAPRHLVTSAFMALGFAFNMTLGYLAVEFLVGKVKSHNK